VPRRAAQVVFVGLLVVPFAFLAVAVAKQWAGGAPELRAVLFWIAIAVSAFDIALSRVLPGRIPLSRTGPEATAFARLSLAWALCEAAILFPLVAYIMTGDGRLLGVFALDVIALLTLWPSDARWKAALPPAPGQAPPAQRMVR